MSWARLFHTPANFTRPVSIPPGWYQSRPNGITQAGEIMRNPTNDYLNLIAPNGEPITVRNPELDTDLPPVTIYCDPKLNRLLHAAALLCLAVAGVLGWVVWRVVR